MRSITAVPRRGLSATFAVTVAGAAVLALTVSSSPVMPSATAAPDPCAASEVAATIGAVATSTADYLDEHPQTNQALTVIAKQQGGPQSLAAVKTYFDANPQAAKDMQQLQQPLASLSARCKLPLTLPQMMGLMQAAQQAQGSPTLPASLPGGVHNAPTAGSTGAVSPTQPAAASPVSQGTGALPGAAIAGLP
ncbi:hemophore [Mycobacterium neglectum]|jgi:hemophore|uniref:hemophore n=1 Tax=Mycobacterium neglectum TaxID=242737 RepID=UPI000BFEB117|nr:hemophore [Mycobacterium neglectum]